jgi:hypothetical protein
MVLPFFILLLFQISSRVSEAKDFRNNVIFKLVVFGLLFILLQVLRIYGQQYFPDVPEYLNIFNSVKSIDFVLKFGYGLEHYEDVDDFGGFISIPIERGFLYSISIFKFFSSSFSGFLFVLSLFQLSVFYLFCKRFNIPLISALTAYVGLLFITFHLGMLRQAIAFSFFLLGLINLNRKFLYVILIFIGSFFHKSIYVCLPFIFSDRLMPKTFLHVVSMTCLIIYIMKVDVVTGFLKYFVQIEAFDLAKVGFYLNVERYNNYLGIGFWERLILLYALLFAQSDLHDKNLLNQKLNILFNLGLFIILFQLLFFSSPTLTSRFRYYFAIFPVLFLFEYLRKLGSVAFRRMGQFVILIYLHFQLFFLSSYLRL